MWKNRKMSQEISVMGTDPWNLEFSCLSFDIAGHLLSLVVFLCITNSFHVKVFKSNIMHVKVPSEDELFCPTTSVMDSTISLKGQCCT
ncbi:hypothetical protein VNO78_14807 [Psophocarpus tetragonolobus]|uniref:Uncharacterized protein n=1 Tax=Psophocarpus tetragonolobus TaxID=3891 RepID=A0AAN9SF95_PSOTE